MFRIFTAISVIYTSRLLHNNIYDILLNNNIESPQLFIFEPKINETIKYEEIDKFLRINTMLQ